MFVLSHTLRFQVFRRGNCISIVKYSPDDCKWYAQVYQCVEKWNDFVREFASWSGKTVGQIVAPMHSTLVEFADFPPLRRRWQLPHNVSAKECLRRVYSERVGIKVYPYLPQCYFLVAFFMLSNMLYIYGTP